MRRTGLSKPSVWRWQERYVEARVEGLLRDKTRPSRVPPLDQSKVAEVIRRTLEDPARRGHPLDRTRDGPRERRVAGQGPRDLADGGPAPHRVRRFKLSNDPAFARKVEDVVGLYVDPPAHAVVLSVDEKSQIQALDRTQPGLPMTPGRLGTMTHDYKHHGTTTLFAALDVLEGAVIGQCMQRHRNQEFVRFLNTIERAIPTGKVIHVILDNYAAHKHPNVRKWLARHPRWIFHFTPTSCSWRNAAGAVPPARPPRSAGSARRKARTRRRTR